MIVIEYYNLQPNISNGETFQTYLNEIYEN